MKCPSCGADNRPQAKRCKVCSGVLPSAQPLAPTQMVGPSLALPGMPATGPRLLVEDGRVYPLTQMVITLGRDPSCQIALNDPRVSRHHAEIHQQGADYVLTDQGSSNGTSVNGQKIAGPCSLKPGDRISFGGVVCTFQTGAGGFNSVAGPASLAPGVSASAPGPPFAAGQSHSNVMQPRPSTPPVVVDQTASADIWDKFKKLGEPQVRGKVINTPQERQDQPPTDIARLLVLFWVVFMFISVLLSFIAFVVALAAILICLGGAALLFIIPFIWMPLQMLFGGLMGWLKSDKPVIVVSFQVQDERTGRPADISFIRKRAAGGSVNLGDQVEVWGKRKGGDLIQASKVRVYESQGMSTSINIPIHKPWPLWVGLFPILVSIVVVIGYLIYGYAQGLYP